MRLVEELFPRTIVMDEGLIVADENTREILTDEKFLERTWVGEAVKESGEVNSD
jgi:ABC-type branched-subunit amino acid transport system ATPase component